MNLIKFVEVSQQRDGRYDLRWSEEFSRGVVSIYIGDSPESIDLRQSIASSGNNQATVSASAVNTRHYFYLEADNGNAVTVAERLLPLEGGVNFRDFGGYPSMDGRKVKWNKLYRSGYMSKLSEQDVAYLSRLNIITCCDFRNEGEQLNEPSLLPSTTERISLTIKPGNFESFWAMLSTKENGAEKMPELMQQLNLDLVENQVEQYGNMLRHFCELDQGALLINCSAGKDRTGFGAALLLMTLGVPREAIIHDYLLSRKYFLPAVEMPRIIEKYSAKSGVAVDEEMLLPMLEVREEYLGAALDHIENEYGTAEQYLQQKFSIYSDTLEDLRYRFTE